MRPLRTIINARIDPDIKPLRLQSICQPVSITVIVMAVTDKNVTHNASTSKWLAVIIQLNPAAK
jgi:hypothetical protein